MTPKTSFPKNLASRATSPAPARSKWGSVLGTVVRSCVGRLNVRRDRRNPQPTRDHRRPCPSSGESPIVKDFRRLYSVGESPANDCRRPVLKFDESIVKDFRRPPVKFCWSPDKDPRRPPGGAPDKDPRRPDRPFFRRSTVCMSWPSL